MNHMNTIRPRIWLCIVTPSSSPSIHHPPPHCSLTSSTRQRPGSHERLNQSYNGYGGEITPVRSWCEGTYGCRTHVDDHRTNHLQSRLTRVLVYTESRVAALSSHVLSAYASGHQPIQSQHSMPNILVLYLRFCYNSMTLALFLAILHDLTQHYPNATQTGTVQSARLRPLWNMTLALDVGVTLNLYVGHISRGNSLSYLCVGWGECAKTCHHQVWCD